MYASAHTGTAVDELRRINPWDKRDKGRRDTRRVARCTARNRAIAEQPFVPLRVTR